MSLPLKLDYPWALLGPFDYSQSTVHFYSISAEV